MTLGKVWNKASTRVMVYGGDWDSAQTTVRAMTFAKMVDLARDRVKFYVSDLYHDALWLNEQVNGPATFEWVARESGTHIGDTAKLVKDDDWADSARYRFEIREDDNQKWVLDTYELVVHEGTPIEDCEFATTAVGCIYHPAPPRFGNGCTGYYDGGGSLQHDGDTCPIHEGVGAKAENPVLKDIISMLFEPNIPTLRNDLITEPSAPTRKENAVRDVKEMLEEKLSDLNQKLEELEDAEREIEDAKEIAQRNIDSVEEAINALDLDLEDFYISVDVSFSE